jgi:hypothetical protein
LEEDSNRAGTNRFVCIRESAGEGTCDLVQPVLWSLPPLLPQQLGPAADVVSPTVPSTTGDQASKTTLELPTFDVSQGLSSAEDVQLFSQLPVLLVRDSDALVSSVAVSQLGGEWVSTP